jgi:hypothetical protein
MQRLDHAFEWLSTISWKKDVYGVLILLVGDIFISGMSG